MNRRPHIPFIGRNTWQGGAYLVGWALPLGLGLCVGTGSVEGGQFLLHTAHEEQPLMSNQQTIIQQGLDNQKIVIQTGKHLELRLEQQGDRNTADLRQEGDHNQATTIQQGASNTSRIHQKGSGNRATINQRSQRKSSR